MLKSLYRKSLQRSHGTFWLVLGALGTVVWTSSAVAQQPTLGDESSSSRPQPVTKSAKPINEGAAGSSTVTSRSTVEIEDAPTGQVTAGASSTEVTGEPRARMSDGAELDRIIELYMAGDYRSCEADLGLFLDPAHPNAFSDPGVIERGRLYFATCALLSGHREQARGALRAALEENPLMPSPDSLTFPPPVVSLFLEVRDEVQQLIADREREQVLLLRRENEAARRKVEERRRREEVLEKLAAEESVVRQNSRFIAMVPFGAGQYQNGNNSLGTFFLISEGLLASTAITSGLILENISAKGNDPNRNPNKERFDNQRMAAYQVMKWSFWGLVGVYAIGVTDAQIRFEKETRLPPRRRALPPEIQTDANSETNGEDSDEHSSATVSSRASTGPTETTDTQNVMRQPGITVAPNLAILPRGAFFGLSGRF